jgi:hypothetical protein
VCATPPNPDYITIVPLFQWLPARTHISIFRPSPHYPLVDHRPFYLVYNHLAHRFAFALVLLYRIGNVVLSHLLPQYYPLMGYVCALAYMRGSFSSLPTFP